MRVRFVTREELDHDAKRGAHQGVVAEVERRTEATLDDLAQTDKGPPLIVVLDEVEDPQNVGAILRTVDACGGSGVVRQTRRAAPLDGAAAKASAGAVNYVPSPTSSTSPGPSTSSRRRAFGPWGSTPAQKWPTMNGISPFQQPSS